MPVRPLTVLALVAVLAGGCQRQPPAPAGEPAPTASPAAAPTGPAPRDAPAGAGRLVGSVRVEDPAGDVLDDAGATPADPEPAADLRAVQLVGDGSALEVTFELDGPVPAAAGSLVWSLDVAADGEPVYEVTAQLVGRRLLAAVFDWDTGAQTPLSDPVVDGARLSLSVPATLLQRIDAAFEWRALTQLDGGYEDRVPDSGRAAFPAGFRPSG